MRTFNRAIDIPKAIDWLSNGRTNLVAVVDTASQMVIKLGKLEAMESLIKAKQQRSQAAKANLRIMTYDDLKVFQGLGDQPVVDQPAPAPVPTAAPVPVPTAAPVAAAGTGGNGLANHPPVPAMVLDHLSEQLIESIVNERIKEALDMQQRVYSSKNTLTSIAYSHLQKIRALERQGLSLIREIELSGKADSVWVKEGYVNFQQATMALVRAVTH